MSLVSKLIPMDAVVSVDEIPLTQLPLRIGRGEDVDVYVDDRWVSREHCELDRAKEALVVRDLGSKHGTFVNGLVVRIAELKAGDELSIGLSKFVVRHESDSAEVLVRAVVYSSQ